LVRRELAERIGDATSTFWLLVLPIVLASAAALSLGAPSTIMQSAAGVWFLTYIVAIGVMESLMGREQQQGTHFSLLWADSFLVYTAKVFVCMLTLALLELGVFPVLFAAWFAGAPIRLIPLACLALAVNLYISLISVFLGVLSLQVKNRSTIFMLLGLPLILPVLLFAGQSLGNLLLGVSIVSPVIALVAFSGVIVVFANVVLKEVWWL